MAHIPHITYKVVRHEDGWAYTVNGVFSESFPTHAEAVCPGWRCSAAARCAASSASAWVGKLS